MSVRDTEPLAEIQSALIEDATFSSGLWTSAEVLGYLNQRQYLFLKLTHLGVAWAELSVIPGQPDLDLPEDWIDTVLARWHDDLTDTYTVLPASDSFELDHADPQTALTSNRPQAYRDADIDVRRITLGPPPIASGWVELLYVSLSEALDGTGILFTVPDEWVPYVKYGVLADMLGKDGRGQDLLRARYCEQRWEEGVALAVACLEGLG